MFSYTDFLQDLKQINHEIRSVPSKPNFVPAGMSRNSIQTGTEIEIEVKETPSQKASEINLADVKPNNEENKTDQVDMLIQSEETFEK